MVEVVIILQGMDGVLELFCGELDSSSANSTRRI